MEDTYIPVHSKNSSQSVNHQQEVISSHDRCCCYSYFRSY